MMKRSFVAGGAVLTCVLAGSAMAADLPTRMPTYQPEAFSWSGVYIGVHLGYGWSSNEPRFEVGGAAVSLGSGTINGALGGAQVGVNWQTGAVVLGVEADFSLADMSGETCNITQVGAFFCRSKIERFGTITGRIGGAFDRTLLYLKAGGAWVRDTQSIDILFGGFFQGASSKSKWGWTGGGGVEYAITRNWSAKLEYDFLLFNHKRSAFDFHNNNVPPFDLDIKQRLHTVKLGFNYRFDWGSPSVAK